MMDFTFEESAWEIAMNRLHSGATLSASHFLAMMEQESESAWEEALQMLEDRDILLDIADIPPATPSAETALRLRRELELAREGMRYETLEENDPLRLYLQELAGIPVSGDPQLLAQRCSNGEEHCREQLMNHMLSRVVEHAQTLAGHSVLLLDLMQEGALGLWQAVVQYTDGDIEAYCDRGIRRAMAKAVVSQARANGVGSKMRQALEDYRDTDQRLLVELGRNPTLEEIAQSLHITLQEAEVMVQMLDAARTVDRVKTAAEEREPTADDSAAVEDTAYFQMRQRIADLLSNLNEADAKLITLRYGLEGGLPLTPEETGRKLGLTPEEVVAREASALTKLRQE